MTHSSDTDFESQEYYESLLTWAQGGQLDTRLERQRTLDPLGLARRKALVDALIRDLADAQLEPLAVHQRARALEALTQAVRQEATPGWRRYVGRLVHSTRDTDTPQAALVRRGPAQFHGGRVNALFDAGAFDVDLHLAEDGTLLGQVVSTQEVESLPGGGVALLQTRGGDLRTSSIEEDGEFFFPQTPRETVDIILNMPRLEIVVRDVDLLKA